ncbi:MAG TPA: energy transducer TonB [Terriglobales bacterium]|nr:energy transducer TonB [Terriglobales bacterium]
MVTQGAAIVLILWIVGLRAQILKAPQRDYHEMGLVTTPPPVNHQPAPVREFKVPEPVAQLNTPIPENLRLPSPTPKPKINVEDTQAPNVQIAAAKPNLPAATPAIPKRLVQTNVFSTGSSATPTMAAAPQKVQTGGFGDPNGVPAQANSNGKPANIAQLGSFDLPAGPGYGNGTGGAKGARGVVASTGFGNGVATGDGSGRINTSRGNGVVRQAGFGDADAAAVQTVRPKVAEAAPRIVPAEILSKPTPAYTDEARKARVEGEVLLEVVLEASGKVKVLRVVRGLGHGLDESAVRAAEQINFKPALRDGQPSDSTAVLHIIFQ